jgi:hypothetical protein
MVIKDLESMNSSLNIVIFRQVFIYTGYINHLFLYDTNGGSLKILKIVLVSSILFLQLISCKNNPVEASLQPGRRDYVWTITTINPGNESLVLGRISGSSASDVWAVGQSSATATSIWYYNGSQWRCDSVARFIEPSGLYGINRNEVWLGNGNSTIWHFDGLRWHEYGVFNVTGFDWLNLNYFDGTSINNIYGVGYAEAYSNTWKAIIMHYDGTGWSFVNIPDVKVSFETVAIEPNSGVLVMSGTVYDPTGFVAKVYCWDGKELKELLSESGWSFVTKLGNEIFATLASKIYKYSNKQLVLWKDNSNNGINGNIICGRSSSDFFIGGNNGIMQYNGSDFTTIYSTNLTVERGTVIGNDVFFIGLDYSKGKDYIIHGKLK